MKDKPCYEAHITLQQSDRKLAQRAADQWGWVFSEISGCPILGQGTYCYLTGYDPDGIQLKAEMEQIAAWLRREDKTIVLLRLKIERIVYDSKTLRNELEAA
jgi:hypothetical protein